VNEQSLETKVMLLEKRIKEMEKTLTIKFRYQKGDLIPNPIYEWSPPALIDLSQEMLTEVLNPKQVQENGKRNES
jgi:hypothetical protein